MVKAMLISAVCCLVPVLGQEAADDLIYFSGTTVRVSATQLTVKEYSADSEEMVEVTYQINPQVRLEGIDKPTDLLAGEVAMFGYKEQNGKNVIMELNVDRTKDIPADDDTEPAPVE